MLKFLIAATSSNCGKTTVTMAILRALTRRGLKVQPYKCGPDYIDPMFHKLACGMDSVNLDTIMASPKHVKEIFNRYGEGADVSVVEGVMGLYDGREQWHGSSADIANLLDIPVVLIVNARSTAYSVAPMLYGYKHFTPFDLPLNIKGVIFNMVGSEHHFNLLRQACNDVGITCLGYLKRNDKLQIPSRHLGLSITEMEHMEVLINAAADEVTEHVNIDELCRY